MHLEKKKKLLQGLKVIIHPKNENNFIIYHNFPNT